MPLIVSPNLTADRTVSLDRLVPGSVLRPRRAVVTAGCKGLNVGRVLAALEDPAVLVGFLPGEDADLTTRLFAREPVPLVGIEVQGQLRVATIYLEDDGRVTVLNEPGPDVSGDDWERLGAQVSRRLGGGARTSLVCSGSVPPGTPDEAYGRLTEIAHRHGARAIVDAARQALVAALPFAPDVVTPNLSEAEAALGWATGELVDEQGDDVPDRAQDAARALCDAGARSAVVTAGGAGAAFAAADGVRWIPGVPVTARNPIGAGDSFVGGLVQALDTDATPLAAVIRGMAVASASCEHDLAGGFDPDRADELTRAYEAAAGPVGSRGHR